MAAEDVRVRKRNTSTEKECEEERAVSDYTAKGNSEEYHYAQAS